MILHLTNYYTGKAVYINYDNVCFFNTVEGITTLYMIGDTRVQVKEEDYVIKGMVISNNV